MTDTTDEDRMTASRRRAPRDQSGPLSAYAALVGLTALLIVLQGVWAGMFIREGRDNNDSWVAVHDWGARAAIFLALVTVILAVVRLRAYRDLVVGAIALFVLLFLEAFIGGLVGDTPAAQTVHFPLALALVGLAVWLPMRSRAARRARANA